jgi:hypothetical protein
LSQVAVSIPGFPESAGYCATFALAQGSTRPLLASVASFALSERMVWVSATVGGAHTIYFFSRLYAFFEALFLFVLSVVAGLTKTLRLTRLLFAAFVALCHRDIL